MIFLECSKDTMIKRISKRASETTDNLRNDDNDSVLIKRFDTFH